MPRYVIIGGGIAATQAAEMLSSRQPGNEVVLVAEEARPFYLRPRLADFVSGRIPESQLWREFRTTAAARGITVTTGHPVVSIDRAARVIGLSDGTTVGYDTLLVATGAKPRLPDIPGLGLMGVTAFSTYADAARLLDWIPMSQKAVVIGRGLQGVELTRALKQSGLDVTMIVPDQSPWFPALFEVKGAVIEEALEQHGVKVISLDAPVELIGHSDHVHAVRTREGREIPADLVGFAGDQRARVEFLVGSGISLADGIVTDTRLQTTDPNVYAAGDVAQVEVDGDRKPLGYGWARARTQGEAAGRNMAGDDVRIEVGNETEAQAIYGKGILGRWK